MKAFDNSGRLINEVNTFFTEDGKTVSTVTTYSPLDGRPTLQTIQTWDGKTGKGSTQRVINGKILP